MSFIRRCLPALFVPLLVLGLTGCPGLANGGFAKARNPAARAGNSVTVANPSSVNGHNMTQATAEWNSIAGWTLFDVYPQNDSYGLVNADVRFGVMSPICANGNCNDRRKYWVQPILNSDNTVHHCNIWYDPNYRVGDPQTLHPDVVSHELGHCLGFLGGDSDNPNWFGVMGYGGFYTGMNYPEWQNHDAPWWGTDDAGMLQNVGYR